MKKIELIETTAVDRGLNAGRPATYEFRKGRAVTDEDFARPHAKGEGVT